jgi:protein ImuA
MSQSGVSERIGFLRARIAAIEARDLAQAPEPCGRDEPLAGLFRRGALSEALPARPSDAPAAGAFALALALRAQAARGGALLWIVEDFSAREYGLPYGRGLMMAGADLARLALIRARRPRETLWAMEEALKSPACAAVVAESCLSPRHYGLSASRRLLLAARRGGALGLLVAPGVDAQRLSSAAEWRVEIAAAPEPSVRPRPALDPAAPFRWRLRTLKARAGLLNGMAGADPARWREIAFDPEKAVFYHALPLRFSAAACDRPAAAESWRGAHPPLEEEDRAARRSGAG